jgi:hypothetical protein
LRNTRYAISAFCTGAGSVPVRKLKIQIWLICASHESCALPLPGLLAAACWWSERDRAARDDEPADVDLRDGHRQDRRLDRRTVGIGPGGRGEAGLGGEGVR